MGEPVSTTVTVKDMSAIKQILQPLIQLWALYLSFFIQINIISLIFDLVRTLVESIRLPHGVGV